MNIELLQIWLLYFLQNTNTKLVQMKKLSLLMLLQIITVGIVCSQGFDPREMAAREKQNLYELLTDLSGDQVTLIDGVYEEDKE